MNLFTETPPNSLQPRLVRETDLPSIRERFDQLQWKVIREPDSWLKTAYELLVDGFARDALDPCRYYVDWLKLNQQRIHPFPYLLMVAYFENNHEAQVVGVTSGNIMKVADYVKGKSASTDPMYIYAIGHHLTAKEIRQAGIKGIGTKLWRAAMREADTQARELGGTFRYSVLESEDRSIGFWAKLGYLWPQGVYYWQPPLEFDDEGNFIYAEVAQILMIKPMSDEPSQTIERILVQNIVATIYLNWSLYQFRNSLGEKAMQRAENYVMNSVFGRVCRKMPAQEYLPLVRVENRLEELKVLLNASISPK